MKIKRLLMALLLLSFCVCSFTAQSAQENLTKLEDYIINISNDALKQNEYVMSLEMKSEELERLVEKSEQQQKEQLKMQEMLQKQLKSYEVKYKSWKTFAMVAIPLTAITTGLIVSWVCNK